MSVVTDGGGEAVGQRIADRMLFNDHWAITVWAKNTDQPACYNCTKPFSLFNRYHHCRSCGNCICTACSMFKPLACFGYNRARICKYCCGQKYMEVQVDGRTDKPDYKYSHYSRSKEAAHQTKSVQALVNDKVFTLGKFGLQSSDFAESHGGVTNTRAVNVKCFRRWLSRGSEKQLIYNEINNLRIFFHPNICRVIRTNIPTDGLTMPEFPFIMTEHAAFGTLSDFLQDRFVDRVNNRTMDRTMGDWQLLLRMLVQLVGTLKYLEETHHMMHNDLHCGNILVVKDCLRFDEDEAPVLIKLSDFTNTRSSDKELAQLKPIPTHRALEIWRHEESDVAADVFSFGQTVAQILLVKPKSFLANYAVEDVGVAIGDAIANKVLPPIGKEKSAIGIELADIVRACWGQPEERPIWEELEETLQGMESRYFPHASGAHLAAEVTDTEGASDESDLQLQYQEKLHHQQQHQEQDQQQQYLEKPQEPQDYLENLEEGAF